MKPEERTQKLAAIYNGEEINGAAVAALIDECKAAVALLTDQEEIREALKKIDGKREVAASDPDDLAEWVMSI